MHVIIFVINILFSLLFAHCHDALPVNRLCTLDSFQNIDDSDAILSDLHTEFPSGKKLSNFCLSIDSKTLMFEELLHVFRKKVHITPNIIEGVFV